MRELQLRVLQLEGERGSWRSERLSLVTALARFESPLQMINICLCVCHCCFASVCHSCSWYISVCMSTALLIFSHIVLCAVVCFYFPSIFTAGLCRREQTYHCRADYSSSGTVCVFYARPPAARQLKQAARAPVPTTKRRSRSCQTNSSGASHTVATSAGTPLVMRF